MSFIKRHAALLAVSAVLLGVIAWQYAETRRLRRALAARSPASTSAAAAATASADEAASAAERAPVAGPGRRDPSAMLGKLDQVVRATQSASPDQPDSADDSRESRRERRQRFIRMMLGRLPDETDEQYRARVAPLVTGVLSRPRERFEQRRKDFEAAADITPEQHDAMDRAIADAHAELLALANKSIAAGDLTPYKRNPRGVLSFLGGAVSTVDGIDDRLRKVLTPEQMSMMEQTDFDMVEYLGVTAPWEKANPPPPEGK